jgi:hypothetical protein
LLGLATTGEPAAGQETRRLRRIERPAPAAPLYQGPALPLPTREQCEAAVRRIAADYGPGGLEPHLAPEFPYREELLDVLERVALVATRIELRVESVESVEIEPWRLTPRGPAGAGEGEREVFSDCLADVRTRLSFDDPETARRIVRDVGRAQWRVRFFTVLAEGER